MSKKGAKSITPSFESLIAIIKKKIKDDAELKNMVSNDDIEKIIGYLFDNEHSKDKARVSKEFEKIMDEIIEKKFKEGEEK